MEALPPLFLVNNCGGANMSKKSITNFSLEKAFAPISKSSVFDQLMTEIHVKEIPLRYIESILVQYHDGNRMEIEPSELKRSVSLDESLSSNFPEYSTKDVKDIRVFISTEKLETDVNIMVDIILGKYC
jgi:hypothetical protein